MTAIKLFIIAPATAGQTEFSVLADFLAMTHKIGLISALLLQVARLRDVSDPKRLGSKIALVLARLRHH
jgi:hypothetical protein